MSDSEEETPVSGIQLSEENWIILKRFLHQLIVVYLDNNKRYPIWFGMQFERKQNYLLEAAAAMWENRGHAALFGQTETRLDKA